MFEDKESDKCTNHLLYLESPRAHNRLLAYKNMDTYAGNLL
jgi:hypothetical protein